MRIVKLHDVIHLFIGGTVRVGRNKTTRIISGYDKGLPDGHGDYYDICVVCADGTKLPCGLNDVDAIQDGKKLFINEGGIKLTLEKPERRKKVSAKAKE